MVVGLARARLEIYAPLKLDPLPFWRQVGARVLLLRNRSCDPDKDMRKVKVPVTETAAAIAWF